MLRNSQPAAGVRLQRFEDRSEDGVDGSQQTCHPPIVASLAAFMASPPAAMSRYRSPLPLASRTYHDNRIGPTIGPTIGAGMGGRPRRR